MEPDLPDAQRPPPQTEDEHRVHALNIHGQFFEKWCEQVVRTTENWKVEAVEEPVELDLPGRVRVEGTVDILAERGEKQRLTLPIECKKANPDLAQWVFFPHRYDDLPIQLRRHRSIASSSTTAGWRLERDTVDWPRRPTVCDAAREVRGQYGTHKVQNWTKTRNTAIRDASEQVATAQRALVMDDARRAVAASQSAGTRWTEQRVFVPVIATTAELLVCRFSAEDVDPTTGEVPLSRATFERTASVIYEYPLPPRLQLDDEVRVSSDGSFERSGTRLAILVVNSRHFESTLKDLADDRSRMLMFRVPDTT